MTWAYPQDHVSDHVNEGPRESFKLIWRFELMIKLLRLRYNPTFRVKGTRRMAEGGRTVAGNFRQDVNRADQPFTFVKWFRYVHSPVVL